MRVEVYQFKLDNKLILSIGVGEKGRLELKLRLKEKVGMLQLLGWGKC